LTSKDTSKVFALESEEDAQLSSEAVRELLVAVLEQGKQFRFRAGGMSMFPFIRNGDVVTISPLDRHGPRLGDVIAFLQITNNSLTLHRVVGVDGHQYVLRGDSAIQSDGGIPIENILGKAVRVERRGRNVRLGIGSGNRAIAALSRWGVLQKAVSFCVNTVALIRRLIQPGRDGLEQVTTNGGKNRGG
jgi:signal peptidase I